jgi:uncharacterized membrane protein YkoI
MIRLSPAQVNRIVEHTAQGELIAMSLEETNLQNATVLSVHVLTKQGSVTELISAKGEVLELERKEMTE